MIESNEQAGSSTSQSTEKQVLTATGPINGMFIGLVSKYES